MKCIVTRQSATWLQQADLISALDETHALLQAKPHACRQNLPWLLWNVLLTTAYVQSHYKYMFLVARNLYEMFVLYRGKHATRSSTVGIWNELRVYRAPVHEHIVGRLPTVGQVSRQTALDVFVEKWMFYSCYSSLCFIPHNQGTKQGPQFADHWAQSIHYSVIRVL